MFNLPENVFDLACADNKRLEERMRLDHPGHVPIRLCPRIAAHAEPFIARLRDARFHERVRTRAERGGGDSRAAGRVMAVSDASLILAIRNVAQHGDTDVYPYPLENHWSHDDEATVLELLKAIDQGFDEHLGSYPVIYVTSLSPVGYAGFRGATQIDPIWNAYLLALVIEIGADLENARLPPSEGITFSYRFHPSSEAATLFDADLGWASFQRTALQKAEERQVIVSTDISDFYPRVYHHRLEHALNDATHNTEVVRRILLILAKLVPGEVSLGCLSGACRADTRRDSLESNRSAAANGGDRILPLRR